MASNITWTKRLKRSIHSKFSPFLGSISGVKKGAFPLVLGGYKTFSNWFFFWGPFSFTKRGRCPLFLRSSQNYFSNCYFLRIFFHSQKGGVASLFLRSLQTYFWTQEPLCETNSTINLFEYYSISIILINSIINFEFI